MKLYKIEKGMKVPPPAHSTSGETISPAVATMQALQKGDSFLIKDALDAVRGEKKMRDLNARQRENGSGRVYTARKIGGGVRIWRVK